jgi:hypothetical protein
VFISRARAAIAASGNLRVGIPWRILAAWRARKLSNGKIMKLSFSNSLIFSSSDLVSLGNDKSSHSVIEEIKRGMVWKRHY